MINYREEFLKDPKYADMLQPAREMMAAAICPGCGTFASQFHHVDCPEVKKWVEEGNCILT